MIAQSLQLGIAVSRGELPLTLTQPLAAELPSQQNLRPSDLINDKAPAAAAPSIDVKMGDSRE